MQRSEKVFFDGALGGQLAGRLERPSGPVRAYALFAHCFTCSKDVTAASRIARALAGQGIGVLRFDFTGLGGSDGAFENTNFSSNVADLIAAAAYLRKEHRAPALLIGHSWGGAACLVAAGEIPECVAVATLGAPFDPQHVENLFEDNIAEIHAEGSARVEIAGRQFSIKKSFLDDLDEQRTRERLAGLDKALLVMHSPIDEIVGVENARLIFEAAKHPKSFVAIDGASHLLPARRDAVFAASIISAWAARYVDEDLPELLPAQAEGAVVVRETKRGKFQQEVRVGAHIHMFADEPESSGGNDSGPDPYDFVLSGLGACTSMTLRMYADRKGLPLERVTVRLQHEKRYPDDAKDNGDGPKTKIDHIDRELTIEGDKLTPEERQRLVEIANRCPVHRTLEGRVEISTKST